MIRQQSLEINNQLEILANNLNFDYKQNDYKNISDEKLASLYVNQRDDYAFNELVSRYGDKIFRLAMRITKSQQTAEEVLQTVFLKLVEKLSTFRAESKLSTWIYSITANECFKFLNNIKKQYRRELSIEQYNSEDSVVATDDFQTKNEDNNPEKRSISLEQAETLDKAINELSEEYRIVFQLRDVEGLTNKEVANILGLSLPAVKSRTLRARNQIRNKLYKTFPEYNN